jgi:hypothetical protein
MLKSRFGFLFAAILIPGFLLPAIRAQAATELMILLDASSSMSAPGTGGTQTTKFREVQSSITQLLQALPADVAVGLRVVGGTQTADCYYSYRYFSPATGIRSDIQSQIESISPAGERGLYQGIQDSLDDLLLSRTNADRVLLVITDGGDDCDQDFSILASSYEYMGDRPRLFICGLDLSNSVDEELGDFASRMGGRLTTFDNIQDLTRSLLGFAQEFENNFRISLQDTTGQAVAGDIVVRNAQNNQIVAEILDVTDYSLTVPPGTYQVTGQYLGQEVVSDSIAIGVNESRSISIMFPVSREPVTVILRDIYGNAIRARLTFFDSSDEPVLTTEFAATHYVSLPAGIYRVDARVGDSVQTIYDVVVSEGEDNALELEIPIEMSVLEIEVNNYDGIPVNAKITVFDQDGTVVDEADYASYLNSRLPAGTYRVTVDTGSDTYEDSAYLMEGDQMEMPFDVDVPVGDIVVRLRTDSGADVWGVIKIYDNSGNLLERFYEEDWESPDWFIEDIPVGTYRIQAEADNIIRVVSGIEVRANEETEVEVTFPDEAF